MIARLKNNLSLSLLVWPYLIVLFFDIRGSESFSFKYFFLVFLLIFIVDLINQKIFLRTLITKWKWCFIGIYLSIFLFVYGNYFYLPLQASILLLFGYFVKGRILFFALFCILIPVFLIKNIFTFLNRLAIIFCLTFLLFNTISKSNLPVKSLNDTQKTNYLYSKKNKPSASGNTVLLLILDEYSFDPPITHTTKYRSLFNHLGSIGWIVKKKFKSDEIATTISIASLFNYNLKKVFNTDTLNAFAEIDKLQIAGDKIKDSFLINDLESKKIKIYNFSFFDFNNYPAKFRILPISRNFLELLLQGTLYFQIRTGAGVFNLQNIRDPNEAGINDYNNSVLLSLSRQLNNYKPNTFIYAHLLMPHAPISFTPTIYPYGKKFPFGANNFENYHAYRQFTNDLILDLLLKIKHDSKLKIIISGDHGYRAAQADRNFTSAAFYGFDKAQVKSVSTIQDIGILINKTF